MLGIRNKIVSLVHISLGKYLPRVPKKSFIYLLFGQKMFYKKYCIITHSEYMKKGDAQKVERNFCPYLLRVSFYIEGYKIFCIFFLKTSGEYLKKYWQRSHFIAASAPQHCWKWIHKVVNLPRVTITAVSSSRTAVESILYLPSI